MFKKIKNLFAKEEKPVQREQYDVPAPVETVTLISPNGLKNEITKDEWVEKFLKPSLEKNWNNFENLYKIILDAFHNNVINEVKEACFRLYNNDPIRERGTNILGVFYGQNKMYDSAVKVYEKYIETEKESPLIYSNYALMLDEMGEKDRANNYYKESLKLDPNISNVLSILLEKAQVEKENKKYVEIFEEISELPNSWRAKLYLGSIKLKERNVPKANALFTRALEESGQNDEAVSFVSGAYVKEEYYDEVKKIVLPVFNPETHGPYATMNILQMFYKTHDYINGLNLLKFISAFKWENFGDSFIKYENLLNGVRLEIENRKDLKLKNRSFLIKSPIWYYNLKMPNWYFKNKKKQPPSILILPLANLMGDQKDDSPEEKLLLGIPLYINEVLMMNTGIDNHMGINYTDQDLIIFNDHISMEYIKKIKELNNMLDYIMYGEIISKSGNNNGKSYNIKMYLADCQTFEKYELFSGEVNRENLNEVISRTFVNLNAYFNRFIRIPDIKKDDMEYLLSQGEKFRISLNLNDTNHFIPWTFERLFYNQFNLIMNNPTNISYKFDLVSILYNIAKFQPQLLKKIEELVYLLINRKVFSDPAAFKILPVILNIYRDDENYRQIMDALTEEPAEYIDWLNSFIDYTGTF